MAYKPGDALGLNTPDYEEKVLNPSEAMLVKQNTGLASQQQVHQANLNRLGDSIASGRKGLRSDILGQGNADVQQAMARNGPVTTGKGALSRALGRGAGLSRVTQAKSQDFDSGLLRERIAFRNNDVNRKMKGMAILRGNAAAANRIAIQNSARADRHAAQRSQTMGTIAGLAAGFASNPNVRAKVGAGLKGVANKMGDINAGFKFNAGASVRTDNITDFSTQGAFSQHEVVT